MPYGDLQCKDSNVQQKNYSVIVSKRKGSVISVLPSQEIFPAIFSNETIVLSSSISVLKTIICKTLTAQAKTQAPMGILREIAQWRHKS